MKVSNFPGKYQLQLAAAAVYTLLTLLLTYPVAFLLTSHIAGYQGEDNLQWRWFLWWFKHALLTLHTSMIDVSILFAPTGGEQPLYAITSFVPALALPITLLAGPTVSFNLSFLLSFALSGYTTYLLAYYLTRRRWAAFVAGLIFAFYPARFGYATGTFLGQLTTYFLPLYVLALFMLAHRPNWRRSIWAALVLACLCLTWPLHVAYGVVIFTIPFMAWQLFTWLRRPETRGRVKYFALTFGLAFILIIGFYIPLLGSVSQGRNEHLSDTATTPFALDALAFVSPSNHHPILQPLHLLPGYVQRVLADQNDIQERLAYLGLVPLLLVCLGLIKYRRRLLFWLLIALGAMILSLGPLLKFNGELVHLDIEGYTSYIILPYALLRFLPILDWSGVLGRWNVATMLSVAVMAAYGLVYLLSFIKRGGQPGLVVALSGLILFEFLTIFPFPAEPDTVPEFYSQLRQEVATRPQMIIDLPLKGEPAYNNYSMHYQTVHQQPLAGGHFMRKPAGASEMTTFLNQLLLPPLAQSALALPDEHARLNLLSSLGFTKVTARLPFMENEAGQAQLAYLSSWLGQPQREGDIAVFEIPPSGAPASLTPLLEGDGWQPAENSSVLQLQTPADLLVYLPENLAQSVTLQLSLAAPDAERYLSIDLDDYPLARLYLAPEILSYDLPISIQPGVHQLTFRPEEECWQNCAPVSFTRIAFAPLPEEDEASFHRPITFGEQLALVKSSLSSTTAQPGQPVLIYLYWQGQERMQADYSVFVHLNSPTGELVGQADYLLGGWLYPTTRWQPGQISAAPSLFFIPSGAPAGEYQLRTGIYNSETGERLSLSPGADQQDSALLAVMRINP